MKEEEKKQKPGFFKKTRDVTKWVITPGKPVPPGTGELFKKITSFMGSEKNRLHEGSQQLKENGKVTFQDYIDHYELSDEDLKQKRTEIKKIAKIYLFASIIFLLLTVFFKLGGFGFAYIFVGFIFSLLMFLRFALNSLRMMQIKYKNLVGFSVWLSNPHEWL